MRRQDAQQIPASWVGDAPVLILREGAWRRAGESPGRRTTSPRHAGSHARAHALTTSVHARNAVAAPIDNAVDRRQIESRRHRRMGSFIHVSHSLSFTKKKYIFP